MSEITVVKMSMFPQVRYLKIIEKSGYQALPWVRYITQSGGEKITQGNGTHYNSPLKTNTNTADWPLRTTF